MIRSLFILSILLCFHAGLAQAITGKVIDSESGESLSYANVEVGEEMIACNSEGSFTIPEKNNSDETLLTVSFMGYKTVRLTVAALKANQLMVGLQPGVYELETLNISNMKPDADSIMAAVKRNLTANYKPGTEPSKSTVFYREAQTFKPIGLKVTLDKSTGFNKEELRATNAQLKAFTTKLVARPPVEFKEMLSNYYTAVKKVKDKPVFFSKLEMVKAINLKDKNRGVSLNEMQGMATEILFQHLDSTKYYRIKSGLFGSRDTIPLRNGFKDDKVNKSSNLHMARANLSSCMAQNSFFYSPKLNFVRNTELYDYIFEGGIESEDNGYVYILKFKPRKRKAKYEGTLYISESDYAVIRADYALADGKTLGGVNLKFLLGVKQSENQSRGTMVFKKQPAGQGYYLKYASMENGQYIYVNRPLKFIEITEAEKDVVALDLKIETNMVEKAEYFCLSRYEIAENEFDKVQEGDFNYLQLESYDPNLWKDYNIIGPLEEMKQFRVTD